MFGDIGQHLTPYLQAYGALGVFLASIVEEVIAPIPSTVVVLSGGFFLVPEDATIPQALIDIALKVMLPASLGISIGSLFPYYLARLGEEIVIDKFGKFLGINREMIKKAEQYFSTGKTDEWILFLTRAVPIIPSVVIGVFSGLFRIPVREFLLFTFLGSMIRTFVLGLIGWTVGRTYFEYADQLSYAENIVLGLVGLICIGVLAWWIRFIKRRRARRSL